MSLETPLPHGRPRLRRITTSLLVGAALAAGTACALAPAASAVPAATLAPVIGSAAQGGAVIVWLDDQHSDLNLSTQGAARTAAAHADQKPIVAAIKAAGGTDITQLVSVNAVAATVSVAEVQTLRTLAGVKQIVPDSTVPIGDPETTGPATKQKVVPDTTDVSGKKKNADSATPAANAYPTDQCGTEADPLVEPEALTTINAPGMTNNGLDTEPGHGVIVANDGISSAPNGDLVGNPNFVRPAADGGGSVVIGATPGDTTDSTDGEYYGDASSIDAQGTVKYQYSKELPFSGLPASCYFVLVGDAPGASLVDTDNIDTVPSAAGDPATSTTESKIVAGIDAAVIKDHADVINESYGYSNTPGSYATHYAANDAAVDAGVTVVVSSGDSGDSGTVSSPASDPKVIAAGATNTLRESAMAYGFSKWVNNDITPLSSGGTTPNNKVVDLVAPGYGGEAACSPKGSDCPMNTATEAFGGTSEAAPLIAGAAADVIQAYRDTHNGASPSPALVKEILTGTATDVSAPADQQGAGLVNIAAAVAAAQQTLNTSATKTATPSLIPTQTQLDLTGKGGSTTNQTVNLYNPSNAATTVTGTYRSLSAEQQIGSTVTENVSAPDPAAVVPADGAQAAPDVTFTVPSGLDRLDADMIWPDATNGNVLNFVLTDPEGRLRQISYDYGTASTKAGGIGTVPNLQHVEVANPEPGTWTAQIKWGNGRAHLQSAPNVPTSYTGTVSFKAAGQTWVDTPASSPVSIASHGSATIPLSVDFPATPGDHPESVQFAGVSATSGTPASLTSLPIARRTLIPSGGGEFDTTITSTVGRGIGQISTYDINVPAGQPDLGVTVKTPDASADNPMSLYLVNPSGALVTHTATSTRAAALPFTASADGTYQSATFHVANPAAGTWEIDVALKLTSSGKEFTQLVTGDVLPQAPTISAPATGTNATSQTPTISGTGAIGDSVTVADATGAPVCTAVVLAEGTWSCTPSTALAAGPVTLTATQADQTGDPSSASGSVTITIPSTTAVSLAISPAAPKLGQAVTLTATTTGAVDATGVAFHDGTTSLGSATVTDGVATLTLPNGLGVGSHTLTATVAATDTTLASVSNAVTVMISKTGSTISLKLSKSSVVYGHTVTGTITVGGAKAGSVTVTYAKVTEKVAVSASGTAGFTIPATLYAGRYTVGATYTGTATVAASGKATAALTVTEEPTKVSLTLKKTTVQRGKTDKVTVKISGHASGRYPGGTVRVRTTLGKKVTSTTITLRQGDKGVRSITIRIPDVTGKAKVRAYYSGSVNFTAATSAAKTVKSVRKA